MFIKRLGEHHVLIWWKMREQSTLTESWRKRVSDSSSLLIVASCLTWHIHLV